MKKISLENSELSKVEVESNLIITQSVITVIGDYRAQLARLGDEPNDTFKDALFDLERLWKIGRCNPLFLRAEKDENFAPLRPLLRKTLRDYAALWNLGADHPSEYYKYLTELTMEAQAKKSWKCLVVHKSVGATIYFPSITFDDEDNNKIILELSNMGNGNGLHFLSQLINIPDTQSLVYEDEDEDEDETDFDTICETTEYPIDEIEDTRCPAERKKTLGPWTAYTPTELDDKELPF